MVWLRFFTIYNRIGYTKIASKIKQAVVYILKKKAFTVSKKNPFAMF